MRGSNRRDRDRLSVVLAVLTAFVMAAAAGCTQLSRAVPDSEVDGIEVDRAAVADIASRSPGNGRFRSRSEVGAEGYGVVEAVVNGEFDEAAGAFEARLDLDHLLATSPPGVLTGPVVGGEFVIRGAAGLVFVKVDDRGWILMPGTVDELLASAGVVRPDAMLDLLDSAGDKITEFRGDRIDGEAVVRYSGWLPAEVFDGIPGWGGVGAMGSAPALQEIAGVHASELLDRMIRFDVWVDLDGAVRRLLIEADLDALADVARRVDGTDAGIDRLRMRYVVDWFDLGLATIEPPPRSEVSVIDYAALERGEME